MISYVKGVLEQILENAAVVENHGIGYLVHMPVSALGKLPGQGEPVQLYTNLQIKEDGAFLYGFPTAEESGMFALLTAVTGVGPKVALGILSSLSPAQVIAAILSDDTEAFCKIPRMGKKNAQRICLELRDKIKTAGALAATAAGSQQHLTMSAQERQDAADALIALGYGRGEAIKAVMEVALEDMKTEQIIRLALKKLAAANR
ncbi:MAG: Holliday junction branch migration protein RuvA [Clostridiales bacterium]|jgi:Holliday junction DNA helicase RuvA|nr:Holliday junction branch migration protein RuvA [Clostridiales bacterium]